MVKSAGKKSDPPTERKVVSALRVDLHRSTDLTAGLELEDALNRLAPALAAMRAAVSQHDGIVYQELGDGVLAIFGAPFSNDLHAVMACQTALDLLRRIEALGDPDIRVRVGIHTGLVVAGMNYSAYQRTYDFNGQPLVLAERLQAAAAPGEILVTDQCRRLAQDYIEFGEKTTRSFKGFPAGVDVWPVKGVGQQSKWRAVLSRTVATFVGRADESELVYSLAASSMAARRGACVAIVGEPGVGKSRLAHESADRLRVGGWRAIELECSPILGRSPMTLARALTNALIAELDPKAVEALRAGLSAAQAAAMDVAIGGDSAAASTTWTTSTPRARARALVEAVSALAAWAVANNPTIILIEDLQWADEASGPVMEAIVRLLARHRLLILATARPGPLPRWMKGADPQTIKLVPLETRAGMAMLDHLLGVSPRLADVKSRILGHTGGLPLFVEEVCRRLVETGALEGDWGSFEPGASTVDLGVPSTVQGVIASRIDRLSPDEKRLLQVASACGPRAPGPLLAVVSGLKDAVFQSSLAALIAAAMLVPAAEGGARDEPGLEFPHEMVRQVAYDAVLGSTRVELHRLILQKLEADAADGRIETAALVHHAQMAQEWVRAADYAAEIARQCLAQSSLPDATRYFDTAMSAVDRLASSPEREVRAIDLRIEARLAYGNHGKVARWLDLAREAEQRAQAIGDDKRRTAALAARAAAMNFCANPLDALQAGQEAVRQAAASGEEGWLAYAQYGLGQASFIAGDFRASIDFLAEAYDRFERGGFQPIAGSTREQAALLCCMMTCVSQIALGDRRAAEAAQRDADAMAANASRAFDAVATGFSRGALHLQGGEFALAETTLADAFARAQQNEINLFLPVIGYQYGLALLLRGKRDEARAVLSAARAEAETLGHRSASLRCDLYLALCDALGKDRRKTALAAARAIGHAARQQGYAPVEMEALLLESRLIAGHEPPDAAMRRAEAMALAGRMEARGTLRDVERNLDVLL